LTSDGIGTGGRSSICRGCGRGTTKPILGELARRDLMRSSRSPFCSFPPGRSGRSRLPGRPGPGGAGFPAASGLACSFLPICLDSRTRCFCAPWSRRAPGRSRQAGHDQERQDWHAGIRPKTTSIEAPRPWPWLEEDLAADGGAQVGLADGAGDDQARPRWKR